MKFTDSLLVLALAFSKVQADSHVECSEDADCTKMFCGTDGHCYEYTCENFFMHHPHSMYDADNAGELTCVEEGWDSVHTINYGCAAAAGSVVAEGQGVGMAPTRSCTGVANSNADFVSELECFDFAPNTNFTDFVAEADASTPACEAGVDSHWFYNVDYTVTMDYNGTTGSTEYQGLGPDMTDAWDATTAMDTMFAVVTVMDAPSNSTSEDAAFQPLSWMAGSVVAGLVMSLQL